jgi:Cu/Ag efflux protein CusF
MNRPLAATLLSLLLALSVSALAHHEPAAQGGGKAAAGDATPFTNGVVKKVDKARGQVTIAHEPLTNLGMPAMTMAYRVKDNAWLDAVKEGEKIRFVAENVNGALVVVALQPAK